MRAPAEARGLRALRHAACFGLFQGREHRAQFLDHFGRGSRKKLHARQTAPAPHDRSFDRADPIVDQRDAALRRNRPREHDPAPRRETSTMVQDWRRSRSSSIVGQCTAIRLVRRFRFDSMRAIPVLKTDRSRGADGFRPSAPRRRVGRPESTFRFIRQIRPNPCPARAVPRTWRYRTAVRGAAFSRRTAAPRRMKRSISKRS